VSSPILVGPSMMEFRESRQTAVSLIGSSGHVLDFYAHRSGHESLQYCPRRRYLNYHHLGTGVNLFPPLYFDVGTAFHFISTFIDPNRHLSPADYGSQEAMAETVAYTIDWFQNQPVCQTMRADEKSEQETLVAGMLWTFFYRVWPSFSARFEILMAEPLAVDTREFELIRQQAVAGLVANASESPANATETDTPAMEAVPARLHVLSRPDAICRDKQTHEIVAINWKTINSITDERRNNIVASLQVNLEAHYAEKLYDRWMDEEFVPDIPAAIKGKALMQYLDEATAYYKSLPREVAYTQIVYMVKGQRQLVLSTGEEIPSEDYDKHVNEDKFWRQDSLLCYRWVDLSAGRGKDGSRAKPFGSLPRPASSWSYRYYKEGNASYNNLPAEYARQGIWESDVSIREHVQLLNEGKVFPSTWNVDDERNDANPLDRIVLFETPIYRDVEMQTRLRRSMINREFDVAQRLIRVQQAVASGEELDDVLDYEFPMQLISCRKPTRCEYDGRICNTPAESRQPLFQILPAGGQWQQRIPHHAAEKNYLDAIYKR